MFCKHCGKDIDIKSRTCPYCGEETDFLSGVDGEKKPEHIAEFEEELHNIRTNQPNAADDGDGDEYEDISSYRTGKTKEEKNINNNVSDHLLEKEEKKNKDNEPADEKGVKTWRILMIVCIVVIVVSLIIIAVASSKKNSTPKNTATSDTAATTIVDSTVTNTTGDKNSSTTPSSKANESESSTASTTQPTSATTANKSIQEYLAEAVPNESTAVSNAQTLYADLEAACAKGDFNKFKTYFNSSFRDSEIKAIMDEWQPKCSAYSSFVVGYTHTVSCSDYTYVYIAATINLETQEYVENTFVLTSDGKLDQSEAGKEWLTQAANIV